MEMIRLLRATVGHERTSPTRNRFQYKVFYVDFPVTENAVSLPRFFSLNRFNIFSIYSKDHGRRDGSSWHAWFSEQCSARGIAVKTDDTVRLISHPRLFGFAFNPISFWVLQDKNENIKAVLCEVHNTFGDDHNYLLAHDDGHFINKHDVFKADKQLYVSPFNTMQGHYLFSFLVRADRFESHIKYFVGDTLTVDTYMGGTLLPLTPLTILRSVVEYPFMTLLVLYRIHFQALRLLLKRVTPTLKERPVHTTGKTTHGSTHFRK
jgi:DUF1365 family protein